jgi:TonB C terminal
MTGSATNRESNALGVGLSLALHLVVTLALALWLKFPATTEIVAAGPGEGGEGGGGAIEVGVADQSAILGFAKPQSVSFIGDQQSSVNNTRLETARARDESSEEVLPATERDPASPDTAKTDRPVANQQERIFTGKDERGRSDSQSAQVGRSFGTPSPAMVGGVGLGSGGGFGGGTGLPGGSEYGRRIQAILSRNYSPPAVETAGVEYVIILLRIGRDGKILSISNGRVSAAHFKQRSSLAQLNYAAERAVLAADPLPPFPAGFLAGVQEAQAQVWFRYPK